MNCIHECILTRHCRILKIKTFSRITKTKSKQSVEELLAVSVKL